MIDLILLLASDLIGSSPHILNILSTNGLSVLHDGLNGGKG
jgi:hypothetical protein